MATVDTGTGQPLGSFRLDDGIAYRSLAVGPSTGHVYVFGDRGGEALVTIVDAEHWTELATWTAHPADGHDWRIYAGAVSQDETRLYLSYHGPDTTGIDWFEVTADGLQRCPASQWANAGCIGGHGGFTLVGDHLLAATGLPVIVEVNAAGTITAGYDTRLEGNHLMEFAVDRAAERVYAVDRAATVAVSAPCGWTAPA